MQDMTFVIAPDRAVAELWETLGSVGIAMEASSTFPTKEGRVVRVVVADDQAEPARSALAGHGFMPIDQHEVLVVDIDVAPGALGRLARTIADAGARLHTLYLATGDRVVVGADDLDLVRRIV